LPSKNTLSNIVVLQHQGRNKDLPRQGQNKAVCVYQVCITMNTQRNNAHGTEWETITNTGS
jgi:hypothetical protein